MSATAFLLTRVRLVAAAAVLCCVATLPLAAPSHAATDDEQTVSTDPDVIEARERLLRAEGFVAALVADLDEAAGRYEHANAHRLRLESEIVVSHADVDVARERADDARGVFADQVAAAYKRPHLPVALAGAVLHAPDARTALHRAGLLQRLARSQGRRADQAEATVAAHVEEVRNEQVIQAGALGAAEESQRLAAELDASLEAAQRDMATAVTDLTQQEESVRERIAEERRLAEVRRREEAERVAREGQLASAAAIAARGSGPLPPVDGKVCPIGAPNGFIDSWGFPRSGGRTHKGIDMFAVHGMPIYAVDDGHIARVFNNRLGGLSINLIDTDGHRYYYAHLSAVAVTTGQKVSAGEVIGANGNTGNARTTPPHLHWQYHPGNGAPVNPYPLAAALCR